MDTRDILVGARKILEDPAKWIKGDYERNGCYCLVGALTWSAEEEPALDDAMARLQAEVRKRYGRSHSIVMFNDAERTTHADVLSVLDLAIASIPHTEEG